MMSKKIKSIALAAAAVMSLAGAASAATVTYTGGTTTNAGGPGGCPAEKPCLQLSNSGPNSTATFSAGGATFSLISFLYNFSDNAKGITGPGILTLTYAGLGSPINLPGSKDGNTFEFDTAIEDIASFTLSNTGDGVIRLGGIETTISAVPVPASGLLLLGALGLMASRRRKTAA